MVVVVSLKSIFPPLKKTGECEPLLGVVQALGRFADRTPFFRRRSVGCGGRALPVSAPIWSDAWDRDGLLPLDLGFILAPQRPEPPAGRLGTF
jgi:hypothetical protein